MCKLLSVLYFSLFLVLAECYDIHDSRPVEDIKISKHHHRHHKTRSTLNDVARKTDDDTAGVNRTTTKEPTANETENKIEKLGDDNSVNTEDFAPENTTEDNFGRNADTLKTTFMNNLAKTQQTNADENSSNDDNSDSNDANQESPKNGNSDNSLDDAGHSNEINTRKMLTNTSNTLSQDPILDLKARSGLIQSEKDDSSDDSILPDMSKVGIIPEINTDLRSGYVPPEEIVNVPKYPEYIYHLQPPISQQSNNQPPHYNKPSNLRPEMLYIQNPPSRYSPLYINSLEMLYPKLNSREIWRQGNSGQKTKSYFGLTHPNNQIYSMYHDRCPNCMQGRVSSRERSLGQSGGENSYVRGTAYGRMDFHHDDYHDSSSSNAYPLAQDNAEDFNRVQGSSSLLNTRDTEEVSERNAQLSNAPSDSGLFSNPMLPSYFPRSSTLLRRVGLGGAQRFII